MPFKMREVYYFLNPGEENTDLVVEAVTKYIERSDIRDVVVASTSGATALKFAKALKDEARIICVSESPFRREWGNEYPCIDPKIKEELEKLGVIVLDRIPYVLHGFLYETSKYSFPTPETIFKETLYAFGQGMKVAVEVVLSAVDCGVLEPFKDVIGVGGSGVGADTAIVLRSTYPGTVFSKEKEKRLEIREIIAMPLQKKWWD
ncbi:MAG: pyruvate kinase alpha/beta domain-containing protein [Candidatus Methanomethylicaceae archaeon]|nr:pyruvate kinase alpha/beta domain-containing protein [Candidatus Verstraetearchaeota archaeon]